MAPSNFAKRLVAEFRRGGKKSIVLAVLLLIGSYFWISLILRAIAADNGSGLTGDLVHQTASGSQPQAASALPLDADWRVRKQWLDELPILQPRQWDDQLRDPFSWRWLESISEVRKSPKAVASSVRDLGWLKVSSTVVGPRYRAAVINGKIYHPGDLIDDTDHILKDILPEEVVLERDGAQVRVSVVKDSER